MRVFTGSRQLPALRWPVTVELLTTDVVVDVLPAEAVVYEPFTNVVSLDSFAWSELETATVRYLVLPEELTVSR